MPRDHHAGMALAAAAVTAFAGWLLEALTGHAHKVVPFILWSVLRGRGIAAGPSGRPLGFGDLYDHRIAAGTYALVTAGIAAVCRRVRRHAARHARGRRRDARRGRARGSGKPVGHAGPAAAQGPPARRPRRGGPWWVPGDRPAGAAERELAPPGSRAAEVRAGHRPGAPCSARRQRHAVAGSPRRRHGGRRHGRRRAVAGAGGPGIRTGRCRPCHPERTGPHSSASS